MTSFFPQFLARPRSSLPATRGLARFALSLGLLLAPSAVHAQTTGTTSGGITVPVASFRVVRKEQRSTLPLVITRADCLASEHKNSREDWDDPDWTYLTVSPKLAIPNIGTAYFEIWVGTVDCKDYTARQGANDQCARVYQRTTSNFLTAVPLKLSIQDVIHAVANLKTAADAESEVGSGSESDCNEKSLDQRALNFYFLVTSDGTNSKANEAVTDRFKVDLVGPTPPTSVEVASGDTLLFPSWKNDATPNDLAGYRFYCDTGSAPVGAGGAGGAGGASGSSSCGIGSLIAGELPPSNLKACGEVTGSLGVTSGRAAGLTNGQTYAVGVAAFDKVGNEGVLSEIVCAKPEEVTTFFEAYRDAGGKGGGLCGFAPTSPGSFAFLMGTATFGVLAWRRRRVAR